MGNISLVRVGGVCAVLAVVSGTMARIAFGNAWLKSRGVDTLITGHWFDALALLLLIPFALGFYQALRQAGPLVWISVVVFITGASFVLAREFILLGIAYELAPGIADTLRQTGRLVGAVGAVLFFYIGVPLFSFVILRTSVVPKWIGWLGLIAVVGLCWLTLSTLVFSMATPWFLIWGILVWMVVMGVALLRLRESAALDSAA